MSLPLPNIAGSTADDLLALPEDVRCEVVGGVVVEKAAPTMAHGAAQSLLGSELSGRFYGRGGGGRPGGWWFGSEVDVEFETHEVYRPDLAGWRRDRVPERPSGRPVRDRPDWVCEVLSKSTALRDLTDKLQTYHRCGVPHYWVVDLETERLQVHRWSKDGYVLALTAGAEQWVRAEPFDAAAIWLGVVFGRDPEDAPPQAPPDKADEPDA